MVFSNADRAFLQLLLVHSDKADLKCAGALASGRCIDHIQRPSETQGGRSGGVGQIGPAGDRLASIGGCRREGHTRRAGRRTKGQAICFVGNRVIDGDLTLAAACAGRVNHIVRRICSRDVPPSRGYRTCVGDRDRRWQGGQFEGGTSLNVRG